MSHWSNEIIDMRTGNACKTGLGASFRSESIARSKFKQTPETKGGGFLLDLRTADDDIDDSKEIDAATVKALTGKEPESAETYEAGDRAYWLAALRGRSALSEGK